MSRIPSNPRTLTGVEAVIDKDGCGAKLANELDADGYIILTDGGGMCCECFAYECLVSISFVLCLDA